VWAAVFNGATAALALAILLVPWFVATFADGGSSSAGLTAVTVCAGAGQPCRAWSWAAAAREGATAAAVAATSAAQIWAGVMAVPTALISVGGLLHLLAAASSALNALAARKAALAPAEASRAHSCMGTAVTGVGLAASGFTLITLGCGMGILILTALAVAAFFVNGALSVNVLVVTFPGRNAAG
jgi:hypothetical protein